MMLTRCPHCGTTFRVRPTHLKVRQGLVRCGKCREAFDALASLVEDQGEAKVAVVTPPQTEPFEPTQELVVAPLPAVPEPEVEPIPEPAPELTPETTSESEPDAEPGPELEPEPEPAPEPEPEPALILSLHEPAERRQFRWPWLVGSGIALLVLAAQVLLYFRTELIASDPELRPAFAAACDMLGCELDLPRRIDLIGIEASDLMPDKTAPNHLQLTATLKNRAAFEQAWPHLELTLTDTRDRPLLRRALAPGEYLPPQVAAKGFAGQAEQAVQLALETVDTPAVGYRLYIFYP